MHWLVLVVALFWLVPIAVVLLGGHGCAASQVFRTKLLGELFGDPATLYFEPTPPRFPQAHTERT
jgi:hypothetical protein